MCMGHVPRSLQIEGRGHRSRPTIMVSTKYCPVAVQSAFSLSRDQLRVSVVRRAAEVLSSGRGRGSAVGLTSILHALYIHLYSP